MITIYPRPGTAMANLARHLIGLAGGDQAAVKSGRGGLVVADELAARYLAADYPPAAPVVAVVPPGLAGLVVAAENRGGLRRPAVEKVPAPPPARKKATAAGLPARTEEHVHG